MTEFLTIKQIDQVAEAIRDHITAAGMAVPKRCATPQIGIILGSGLGGLAEAPKPAISISYDQLPGWPVSTVVGHSGRLIIGEFEDHPVIMMQGRAHYYEGYSMAQVGLPVRVMQRLGIEMLVVTNAAGAINPDYQPGELMLITDHINMIGMAGLSPLRGPNLDEFGPRFPDMSQAYDPNLRLLARQVAQNNQLKLNEGVYVSLAGPSFETPADLRFLRGIGADAVGMSTVPEVTIARHGGLRVLGISGISNKANLDGSTITTHEEVLEAGQKIVPQLEILVRGVLQSLPASMR